MAKQVKIAGDIKSFKSLMLIIPKDKWYIVEGEIKPSIDCPVCGCGILGDVAPHGVKTNGEVYASVVCQNPYCTFHQHIKLQDWSGGEINHR